MKPTEPQDWDDIESLAADDDELELELDDESGSDDLDLEHIRIFTPESEDDTDDELDFEAASWDLPTVDLTELLETLIGGERHVSGVYGFNDLSAEDVQTFEALWPRVDPELRLAIVTDANEFAEEDFRFDIERFLLAASEDESATVRARAAEGLANVQVDRVASRLLDMLRDDVSDDVRAQAATSLGPFVYLAEFDELDSRVAERLASTLYDIAEDEDESWHVRLRAAESVSAFGPNDRVGALIERMWEEDEIGLRPGAVLMVGRGNMRSWLPRVRTLLQDEDPAMRFEAVTAVGVMGDIDSLPDLSEIALREEDVDVRHQAIISIGTIGGPRAARILTRLTERAPETDQELIASALLEASIEDELI